MNERDDQKLRENNITRESLYIFSELKLYQSIFKKIWKD